MTFLCSACPFAAKDPALLFQHAAWHLERQEAEGERRKQEQGARKLGITLRRRVS